MPGIFPGVPPVPPRTAASSWNLKKSPQGGNDSFRSGSGRIRLPASLDHVGKNRFPEKSKKMGTAK